MRKITVTDLRELSDKEAGVVIHFFQAKQGRKANLIRAAEITAFFGVTLVMNVFLDGMIQDHPEMKDFWFIENLPYLQFGFSILQLLFVGSLMMHAIKWHAEKISYQKMMNSMGINVSSIDENDVFTHLVLPKLQTAGVKVVD